MAGAAGTTFLEDVLVVELGQRLGAGICGSLLAEAGAEVVCVEERGGYAVEKATVRNSLAAGKVCIDWKGNADIPLIADLIRRADVVIISSDTGQTVRRPTVHVLEPIAAALEQARIVCDVTAFGSGAGPFESHVCDDQAIQALAGVMDTTGEPDGPPAFCAAPIIEMSAALYAASGVIAALMALRTQGVGQNVEVALYDVAVGMLATFLPKNFSGGNAQRVGNHHPAMSPWNAFAAKDGWVLLCAGTNDQWSRVAKLIGKPELVSDQRFDTTTKRVANAADVDATIAPWIAQFSVDECVDKLNAISISTGPILEVGSLGSEPNLAHRRMVRVLGDDWLARVIGQTPTYVPGSPLRGSIARGVTPPSLPARNSGLARAAAIARRPLPSKLAVAESPKPSLAGVRVIEMGQFTTAPLVGRQLGALGADVIKLEPNGGEPAREMPPHRNGQGFFFSLSNSDTRVMTLDLRDPGRVELLAKLIEKADVLVENTKPGTLPRHGFTPERILEINPRIVYCAISGFGIDAPSAGLGAMDTTIQGLAGIMDLTRVDGVPYKTGISIADLHAGQFALFATLAALEFRDRTGRGQVIDLAMLDAASWVTRTTWNGPPTAVPEVVVKCTDGYALAPKGITSWKLDGYDGNGPMTYPGTRVELDRTLKQPLLQCSSTPIQSVVEVLAHPQTKERGLIFEAKARDGSSWNLLKCPITLSRTPAEVRRVPGPLNADADEILRDWRIDWRAPS